MRKLKLLGVAAMVLSNSLTSHADLALDVAYGHLAARAVHAACYYKLFDYLADGPKNAQELAAKSSLRADALKRILRVIANRDLIDMDEEGRFSLNVNSQTLLSGVPGSMQQAFAKEFDQKRWSAVGYLKSGLEKGEVGFDSLYDQSFYNYLEENPEAAALFNAGMKNFSQGEDEQVASHFPFKDYASYCDIGGGTGGLIKNVLRVAPGLKTTLFDLPAALVGLEIPSVMLTGGSFFESVPSAEVFTIKRVLHNWDDEKAVQILNNARKAISDRVKGRILVIEKVMPKTIDHTLLIDSEIIGLALGGQERTLDEFADLGAKAGLAIERLIPLERVSIVVFKIAE